MRVRILSGFLVIAFLTPVLVVAPASSLAPAAIHSSPVEPVQIVRLFERPAERWSPGHRGIDLRAAVGQHVTAPGAGVVTFAGPVVDRSVVTILHANGLRSSVEPVEPLVAAGDAVVAGQPVGTVQDVPGHCAPAVCVHWGMRDAETYLNPLDWLAGFGPIRLLPLGD